MKKIPAIFFLITSFLSSFSQPVIKGRVVNAANGEPVAGSSVFISNSSSGTTSDKDGYFELKNVPSGKHELVISCIGYETNVFPFSSQQLPLKLKVEMTVKVKELRSVTVEPFAEEGWAKWGRMFMEHFIGRTPGAAQCRIKNEKAIRFRFYKKSNRVVAYCDEPVILENKALGYRIVYQLEDFEVNYKTGVTFYAGYPLFEELDKSRKGLAGKWQKNRDKAYFGSMQHFMYSLYHDSLLSEGFEVRRVVRLPNTEKERVKQLYRPARMTRPTGNGIVFSIEEKESGSSYPRDSADYYEKVLRQKDYFELVGKDLLSRDSLITREEEGYKVLFFTDYLYITYKYEQEDMEYVQQSEENRPRYFQRSYIRLSNGNPVAVDKQGNYYPPQEVFSSAYWGWSEKMADCLPVDYKPSGKP
ncbi:MAG: carboxypeptidase-like regulatory domain-containing protein [Chitinophagaceae bacterium]|nr:carboxypeptidase-like regulatory domain-containing protein [Chitinophagaceae bacterium]